MEGVLTGEATSSKVIQDHHHLSSKLQQSCPNWSPWINLPPLSFQNNTEWLLLFFFFDSNHLLVLYQITPHLEKKIQTLSRCLNSSVCFGSWLLTTPSVLVSLPCLNTVDPLLFIKHANYQSISRSLPLMFPLSGMVFPQIFA